MDAKADRIMTEKRPPSVLIKSLAVLVGVGWMWLLVLRVRYWLAYAPTGREFVSGLVICTQGLLLSVALYLRQSLTRYLLLGGAVALLVVAYFVQPW
jgi:hypothetical protein